jgi:hypothetical protein
LHNSPFLAAGWVNLEAHGGGDETVVLLIEHIEHLEWTTVLDVTVATQFNSVDLVAESERGVLEWDASAEFTIEQSNLWVALCWGEFNDGQDLREEKGNQIISLSTYFNYQQGTYGKCHNDFGLHFVFDFVCVSGIDSLCF